MRPGKYVPRMMTSVLVLTATSAAMSQDVNVASNSEVDDGFGLEEIIVTASKRAQSIQSVASSIAAVGGEQLERMGATGFEDYFRMVPNLQVIDIGPGRNNIVVRGIETDSQGDTPTSATYFDEIPVTQRVSNPDIHAFDLERVEVLRGPQGTLWGGGALGGLVKLVPRKPNLDETQVAVDGTLSTTKGGGANYEVNALINLPISDKMGIRATAFKSHREGWGHKYEDNM